MPEVLTGYPAFDWIATWSHPVLDAYFRGVTDLGSPVVYYLVVAPLFWVVDRRRGLVLFLLLTLAALLNAEAKLFFDTPRPDPALARVLDLRPLESGSRSFPSGHAQIALVFWGYLAYWVARRWFTAVAVWLIASISFSRIYLGAHFPLDVAGGLLLGTLSLAAIPSLERWSRAGFPLPVAARAALLAFTLAGMYAVADAGLAVLLGCLLALLILLALPASEPSLSWRGAAAVVLCGLALQLAGVAALERVSPAETTFLRGAGVALLWLVALWLYPRAVVAVVARRQPSLAD